MDVEYEAITLAGDFAVIERSDDSAVPVAICYTATELWALRIAGALNAAVAKEQDDRPLLLICPVCSAVTSRALVGRMDGVAYYTFGCGHGTEVRDA